MSPLLQHLLMPSIIRTLLISHYDNESHQSKNGVEWIDNLTVVHKYMDCNLILCHTSPSHKSNTMSLTVTFLAELNGTNETMGTV